jgi:hypothetical protein
MGKRRCVYRFLVGKPEGKRPLGRPRLDGRRIKKKDGSSGGGMWGYGMDRADSG